MQITITTISGIITNMAENDYLDLQPKLGWIPIDIVRASVVFVGCCCNLIVKYFKVRRE